MIAAQLALALFKLQLTTTASTKAYVYEISCPFDTPCSFRRHCHLGVLAELGGLHPGCKKNG